MQKNYKFVELPSFAGIALADILANGVAIILLMIIINLQIKSSAQLDLAEKVKDVSILLSRDIAKQVIMNALPTSPPAHLHNYTTSRIDRFPREEVMPVLELVDDGVKNFYTDVLWPRSSLFSSANDLDQYLSSLNHFQKRHIRVDVYAVKNFYLLKSILKDHGIAIRHWHFNGNGWGHDRSGQPLVERKHALAMNTPKPYTVDRGKKVLKGGAPEGTVYKKNAFLIDDTLTRKRASTIRQETLSIHTNVKNNTGSVSGNIKHTLMIAEGVDNHAEQKTNHITVKDYRNTLAFLFDFLIRLQDLSDKGQFGILKEVSLPTEMTDYVYSFPKLSEYRAFMVEKLYEEMNEEPRNNLHISLSEENHTPGIKVALNKRIEHVDILGDTESLRGVEILDIQVQLSLYPGIFTSVSVPVTPHTIILMPTVNRHSSPFKWHLVTMIDNVMDQSYIGFLYSRVDENNRLLIKAGDNSVLVNQQPIAAKHHLDGNRQNKRLFVLYTLVVMLIVALILKRKRL